MDESSVKEGSLALEEQDFRIFFRIHYEPENEERIFLCGASKELGGWDINRGVELRNDGGSIWSAELKLKGQTRNHIELQSRDQESVSHFTSE
jgi:hypothetical protein